ncbi:MAG: NAD(+) synthase [Halobacteriota archaeon]|uniref:NAD(+) synthase n=1 Tax=Natronomonas sp. TaxID=2184060 RepID=UPI003976795A
MRDVVPNGTAAFRRDGSELRAECTSFIKTTVEDAGAEGVVVRLDGGLESSAIATMAVDALGSERVYGIVLPSSKLGSRSAQDAEAIATALDIEADTIHLQPLLMCVSDIVPAHTDLHGDPIVRADLVARLRMAMTYLAANATDRLVVGSATRTAFLLGSVTKHGDGAADLFPLGGLYGSEAEALGDDLDLPSFVTEAQPMVGQFPGQSGNYGIDAPLETIDAVLYGFVDAGWTRDRIREEFGVDAELVDRIVRHYRAMTRDQREPPIGPTGSSVGDQN